MTMDVERQIDGLVGRWLSWLTQPPIRPADGDGGSAVGGAKKPAAKEKPVSRKATGKRRAAKKPAARKPAAKKPAAKRVTTKKPAARKPAARKPKAKKPAGDLDRFVDGTARATDASGDLAEKILAALAGSAEGATLPELQKATGGQLAAVRRQLNQLLKAGKIQRGQGIGTRYRLDQTQETGR